MLTEGTVCRFLLNRCSNKICGNLLFNNYSSRPAALAKEKRFRQWCCPGW